LIQLRFDSLTLYTYSA